MLIHHISDTHTYHAQIQPSDLNGARVLIHSGDATHSGFEVDRKATKENYEQFEKFVDWFSSIQNADRSLERKIFVPGNHDLFVARKPKEARELLESKGIELLIDETTDLFGHLLYGSPWSPSFGEWVFMKDRSKMHTKWSNIPKDVEILVTHGPPMFIQDLAYKRIEKTIESVGCLALYKRIQELPKLALNLYGHIHASDKVLNTGIKLRGNIVFSNAAAVDHTGKRDYKINFKGNQIEI